MKQTSVRFLRVFALLCLAAAVCFFFSRGKITAASLLKWFPRRSPAAALCLIGLYLAKSLSFFFPLAVLQTVCGAVFPPLPALMLNLCGTAAAMSLPWLLCRFIKVDFAKLQRRFPVLQRVREFRPSSDFLYTLFLRAAGFPFDAVSFYLGTQGVSLRTYLSAGLIGCLPHLLLATALGAGISRPSLRLLPAVGACAALCIVVLTVCRILKKQAK